MGKYFIYLIAYRFVVRRYGRFNGIVKQVVYVIIAGYRFAGLRFLRMKAVFFLQLLNAIALGRS
jgi:hypothetical protein